MSDVLESMGVTRKLDEVRMVEAWHAVAGPAISRATTSAWVRRETLFVKMRSSAWRHELHLQRSTWRTRLNEELGHDLVREIRFC